MRAEYSVRFVDYGNDALVSDVRRLPDQLAVLEKCAIRCALQPKNDAAQSNVLSETDCVALINEHAGEMTFKVVSITHQADDEATPHFVVRMWTDAERTAEVLVGAAPVE